MYAAFGIFDMENEQEPKKKKSGKQRTGYFYEREEAAVVDFISTDDQATRDRIYKEILYTAFTKMIESIIRRYNLYVPDEDFQETFDDTMSFLTTKLSYYDPSRNFKAFSYCGTICKNYLIYKLSQFSKKQSKNVSYEEICVDKSKDNIEDSIQFSYTSDDNPLDFFKAITSTTVEKVKKMIDSGMASEERPMTENEKKVGMALIELLSNWEELFIETGSNKFNKSSVILFIKEYTELPPKEISKAMRLYKNFYAELKKILLKEGY